MACFQAWPVLSPASAGVPTWHVVLCRPGHVHGWILSSRCLWRVCASTESLVPKEEEESHTFSRRSTLKLIKLMCLVNPENPCLRVRECAVRRVPTPVPLNRQSRPPLSGGPTKHKAESFLPAHSGFVVCTARGWDQLCCDLREQRWPFGAGSRPVPHSPSVLVSTCQ